MALNIANWYSVLFFTDMCSGFIEIHRAPIHTMNKLFDSVSLNYFCIYFFAAFFNFIMH